MEENENIIESLIERTTEYGKTSFELIKLKTLDKASDVVSSFIPNSIVAVFYLSFLLFCNLGLALWLGEILGTIYYGFFLLAVFYGVTGIFIHLFMHKWIKRIVGDNFIKQVLK
ncbi:MAG: hypothetical protein GZ094_12560 [Mariniphaga sp.]|nr:hypothetical protein [Mariniphaga sp.]